MSESKVVAPTFKNFLRQKFKPHNKQIFAVTVLLDSAVTIMTLYSDNPPFDPVIWGVISGIVKAANIGLHYLSKTLQEEDPDAIA